jgi:hypothetical protein
MRSVVVRSWQAIITAVCSNCAVGCKIGEPWHRIVAGEVV